MPTLIIEQSSCTSACSLFHCHAQASSVSLGYDPQPPLGIMVASYTHVCCFILLKYMYLYLVLRLIFSPNVFLYSHHSPTDCFHGFWSTGVWKSLTCLVLVRVSGECGRLSQHSWIYGALLYIPTIGYLLTYLTSSGCCCEFISMFGTLLLVPVRVLRYY